MKANPSNSASSNPAAGSENPPPLAPAAVPGLVADIDRKIIKNAQLTVVVGKTDAAIFQITGIANDVGGYVVSNRLFSDNNQRGATIVLAVPVDRFEESLNRIRQVPQEIVQDHITSSDVTEQYIDLEARLKNLEATATRIRELLTRANTVDEALKINVQLSEIESQIEQIKGKLNALSARTTFSTITVDMREPPPTPTITPTPTATPTPTPAAWRPDETAARALNTQGNLLRALGDTLVWFLIVVVPYLVIAALGVLGVRWLITRSRKRSVP
ncbi:MAG: DUF4349 domain-containing protein [Chloroflexi bacterium]|nr:DUF4349 domain-containing protein [Chloroflexota bacterium]